jgi:hypothetical protein
MTKDGSQKDTARSPTSGPAPSSLPVAWLPLTPRGVAAFAHTTFSRLFLVQCLVALLASAAVVWFTDRAWCPALEEAIRHLPDQGRLSQGQLELPPAPIVPSQEGRFLAVSVDPENRRESDLSCDLRVTFRKESCHICGPLGCWRVPYSKRWTIEFNRTALEPWWGAWKPAVLGGVAATVLVSLLLSWTVLATIYFIPARLAAFYTERNISLAASWRLAGAALMPGSLLLSAGCLFYGSNVLDAPGLGILWVLHVLAGWIYLCVSLLFLPKRPYVPRRPVNPFHPPSSSGRERE